MAGSHGHDATHTEAPRAAHAGPIDDPLSLQGGRWVLPVVLLCAVLLLVFALFRSFGDAIPVTEKHAGAAVVRAFTGPDA